jgi:hypothetical protein
MFAAGVAVGGVIVLMSWAVWVAIETAIRNHQYKKRKAEEELAFVRREQLKRAIREEIVAELGLDTDDEDEIVPDDIEDDEADGPGAAASR